MKEDSYQKPFEIQIQDKKILFSADNLYSRVWKLTRFRNNRRPEEKVSNILIKKFKSCRCFVDVGANLGYYTFLASKFMPKGIIYSFEMDEKNYALLKKNLEINNCKNVNIYHSAVTDHPGFVSYSNTLRSPSPTLILSNQSPNKKFSLKKSVKAVSLDDFFKDKKLLPEIIKIDVEGSE
jgi:FkbM family methyltransferase